MSEFVVVKGGPKANVGELLSVIDGGDYVIESVEVLTMYVVREANMSDLTYISGSLGLTEDDLQFIGLRGDKRSRGMELHMSMRARKKP